MKVNKITPSSPDFPESLKNIPSPPKLLYVLGNLEPLKHTKVVGVIGSRAVTPYGQQITTRLTEELSRRGIANVSGLAHKAAV